MSGETGEQRDGKPPLSEEERTTLLELEKKLLRNPEFIITHDQALQCPLQIYLAVKQRQFNEAEFRKKVLIDLINAHPEIECYFDPNHPLYVPPMSPGGQAIRTILAFLRGEGFVQ